VFGSELRIIAGNSGGYIFRTDSDTTATFYKTNGSILRVAILDLSPLLATSFSVMVVQLNMKLGSELRGKFVSYTCPTIRTATVTAIKIIQASQ